MPRYLSFVITGLFTGACVFYACRPSTIGPELPPDYVAVRAGQSVVTQAGLTVVADTVSVTICPKDAYCIVANSARVKLTLTNDAQTRPVRLFTFIPNYTRRTGFYGLSDSVSTSFGGQLYKVILRDGRYVPGPDNTTIPEAIVQVSRL